jgi:hypothetical protein
MTRRLVSQYGEAERVDEGSGPAAVMLIVFLRSDDMLNK